MAPFLRLIHVSDLHFGDTLYPQKGILHTTSPANIIGGTFHGDRIHDFSAAEALSNSVRSHLLTTSSAIAIVATGDLTTFGTHSAFSVAFTYLRSQHSGAHGRSIGFGSRSLPVVPGNHDIWGGGLIGGASTRAFFEAFFRKPAPLGVYPDSRQFPFRLELISAPLVYLYGLDSSRVDKHQPTTKNVRNRVRQAFAEGFVNKQQMVALHKLISAEPRKPALRIAAIHHPPLEPPPTLIPLGKLINHRELIGTLAARGFKAVLCGHIHRRLIEELKSPKMTILSVGTATQDVGLTDDEERALHLQNFLHSTTEMMARAQALEKANQYAIYDFELSGSDSKQLVITVHTFVYDCLGGSFDEMESPRRVLL